MNRQKMKWTLALAAVVVGFLGSKAMAADNVDASITVTPVATVSLSITPTTYAYGNIETSSQAVATSSLTLTNAGQVNVTVSKRVDIEAANWTVNTAPGANQYALYVATSTFMPAAADYVANDHRFGAVGVGSPLRGLGGTTTALTTSGAASIADLWFRLDTPTTVTTQAPQTITVKFTGTAQ
jgi:hypothetical protein